MCEHLIRKLQFLATEEDATGMNDSAIAMREAATALERLRKDAERYRLLRMYGAQSDKVDKVHYFGPKLDNAIDAAIAAEGEKE